jgi:hypothetical protein
MNVTQKQSIFSEWASRRLGFKLAANGKQNSSRILDLFVANLSQQRPHAVAFLPTNTVQIFEDFDSMTICKFPLESAQFVLGMDYE